MQRQQATEFDQELLDLYDDYAHGRIDRRGFMQGAAKFAAAGVTAEALLATLSPNYAWAQQVAKDDKRISLEIIYGEGISIIEWGDKIRQFLPDNTININISLMENGARKFQIEDLAL